MDEDEIIVVGVEIETANITDVGPKNTRKVKTETSEEVGREVKVEDNVDKITMGSGAAEPEAEPKVGC